MYIFFDESGNFKNNKSDYFIVGGFATSDPRATAKSFRKWQQSKFRNKKLQYRNEVKFSDTRLSDDLRAKTLINLSKQNIRIFYSYLKKENIPLEFRKKNGLESGRLYTEVAAQTLDLLFPSANSELKVYLDRRNLKKISQSKFKETLRLHLLLQLQKDAVVYIDTVDSSTNANIQIADWICGALYRYHSGRANGELFYNILHGSIVASKEMFKDYWANLVKQKTS